MGENTNNQVHRSMLAIVVIEKLGKNIKRWVGMAKYGRHQAHKLNQVAESG